MKENVLVSRSQLLRNPLFRPCQTQGDFLVHISKDAKSESLDPAEMVDESPSVLTPSGAFQPL